MRIKSIKETKPRKVYAIQTSSGTFIADGLAHHNCAGCNIWGGGRIQNTYTIFLLQKYGQDFFEEKVLLSNQDVKLDEDDWLEIYNYYKKKYDELDKGLS